MSKSIAEIRFEKARKRLSLALKELEEVTKNKLHDTAMESRMVEGGKESAEQATMIQNLNLEINNLQQNLLNLGHEVEFLNEKNKVLGQRMNKLRKSNLSFVEAIEADLVRIEEVMKQEE